MSFNGKINLFPLGCIDFFLFRFLILVNSFTNPTNYEVVITEHDFAFLPDKSSSASMSIHSAREEIGSIDHRT